MKKNTPRPDAKTFFSGVPTKVDTDRLMSLLEGYNEGEIVPYEKIEQAIGTSRRSSRGATVISAWKKRALRSANTLLIAVPNEGYRVADPSERVMVSGAWAAQGKRRIFRAAEVAGSTRIADLSPEELRSREFIASIPARLKLHELTAPKE